MQDATSQQACYLLGLATGIIDRVRQYFILNHDTEALMAIEDQYLKLTELTEKLIYKVEKKDV